MHIINQFVSTLSYIVKNLEIFYNRAVECCKGKPKTKAAGKDCSSMLIKLDLDKSNLTRREISSPNSSNSNKIGKARDQILAEKDNVIEIQGTTAREIIDNYVSAHQKILYRKVQCIAFYLGTVDAMGKVHKIHEEISTRLDITKLYYIHSIDTQNRKLALPLLKTGEYKIIDNIGWFMRDPSIQKVFQTITNAHGLMLSFLEITIQKITKYGYTEKISPKNLPFIKGLDNAKRTLEHQEATQEKVACTQFSFPNTRLEIKKQQLRKRHASNQSKVDFRPEILCRLTNLKKFLTGSIWYSDIYPNKTSAYIIFENIFNNYLDIVDFMIQVIRSPYVKTELFDHLQLQFQIFTESLELLRPYANEITNKFNIDLPVLESSLNPSKSAIADLEEYNRIQSEVQSEFAISREEQKNKEKLNPNKLMAKKRKQVPSLPPLPKMKIKVVEPSVKTVMPIASEKSSSEPEKLIFSEKKLVSSTLEEPLKASPQKNEEKVIPLEKPQKDTKDTLEKQLREKQDNNVVRTQRKVQTAQDMVRKYKDEQEKQKEVERKKRQTAQVKIHQLPSEELVWGSILPGLKGYSSHFEIIFGQEESHNKISHQEVVNVAKVLQEILKENEIDCAHDFYNTVISRIHHRHDSDTGALLPRHYVDILRSCFIIFGIFTKNWKPKTEEDFDAMEKYYQRRLDFFYWESKL